MFDNKEDLQLIDRILAGEPGCYAQLVNRYKSYAYTMACRILISQADAEEAAQDAFIKAFHNLKNFNRTAKFSTWLYRIIFNTVISYKRKEKTAHVDISAADIESSHDSHEPLEEDDKRRYIDQAIKQLNETDGLLITLFYLREFSMEETAEIVNMNLNTVKVRLHRARIRLAKELEKILNKEALTL